MALMPMSMGGEDGGLCAALSDCEIVGELD